MATDADCSPDQGTLFAGRYQLQDPLERSSDEPTRERHWRGFDEVLARPVMITVLQTSGRIADDLLAAAVANGRVSHPGVASVFDAAIVDGCTYVVSEWVDGTSLTALLREGPLPPAQAAAVVREAAEAVGAVHAQGLVHGNLHPDNVVLTSEGGIKLTDLRTNGGGKPAEDVHCLGALLYATLTGKWPSDIVGGGVTGLPDAPYDDDRLCAPRQVRAGVPGYLSALAMRAMSPESALTATSLGQGLDHHASEPAPSPLPVEEVEDEPRRSAMRRVVLPISALLIIAMAGLILGVRLGALPTPEGTGLPFDNGVDTKPSPTPPAVAKPLPVAAATILDPSPNSDGQELDNAERVHDGNGSTAWRTDGYRSAEYGGLKAGMGVLLDLGSKANVRKVTITLENAGGRVELRSADTSGDEPEDFALVASQNPPATTFTFTLSAAKGARYWLLWFTSLPLNNRDSDNPYGVGVTEVRFN